MFSSRNISYCKVLGIHFIVTYRLKVWNKWIEFILIKTPSIISAYKQGFITSVGVLNISCLSLIFLRYLADSAKSVQLFKSYEIMSSFYVTSNRQTCHPGTSVIWIGRYYIHYVMYISWILPLCTLASWKLSAWYKHKTGYLPLNLWNYFKLFKFKSYLMVSYFAWSLINYH